MFSIYKHEYFGFFADSNLFRYFSITRSLVFWRRYQPALEWIALTICSAQHCKGCGYFCYYLYHIYNILFSAALVLVNFTEELLLHCLLRGMQIATAATTTLVHFMNEKFNEAHINSTNEMSTSQRWRCWALFALHFKLKHRLQTHTFRFVFCSPFSFSTFWYTRNSIYLFSGRQQCLYFKDDNEYIINIMIYQFVISFQRRKNTWRRTDAQAKKMRE